MARAAAGRNRTRADTSLGPVTIIWQDGPRVLRILLPGTGDREPDCPAVRRLARDIRQALGGRPVRYRVDLLALEPLPCFQQAVLRAAARIPYGRVSTYGRLAAALGRPGAGRAVGNALARNPFPLVIPCHRVIRADRRPGGFGGGAGLKRALLELEGVGFDDAGRVRAGYLG